MGSIAHSSFLKPNIFLIMKTKLLQIKKKKIPFTSKIKLHIAIYIFPICIYNVNT